jgi:hypothetical protein
MKCVIVWVTLGVTSIGVSYVGRQKRTCRFHLQTPRTVQAEYELNFPLLCSRLHTGRPALVAKHALHATLLKRSPSDLPVVFKRSTVDAAVGEACEPTTVPTVVCTMKRHRISYGAFYWM